MKTLFLDFDGVLHPYTAPSACLFVRVIHFERVMRQFPDWQIVISSSWRDHQTLDEMCRRFSADIAERIVGVTPAFHRLDGVPTSLKHHPREAECLAWLTANGCSSEPWLALDDWPFLFRPDCPNLFQVDTTTGLNRYHARALVLRLRGM